MCSVARGHYDEAFAPRASGTDCCISFGVHEAMGELDRYDSNEFQVHFRRSCKIARKYLCWDSASDPLTDIDSHSDARDRSAHIIKARTNICYNLF
jgi:hypothetical protein